MFKSIRDKVSYVVENNLIVDYLCCWPCYAKIRLPISMFGMQLLMVRHGYYINHEKKVRKVSRDGTEEPFDYFAISSDQEERRRIYSKLNDIIDCWVSHFLALHYHMHRLPIPKNIKRGDGSFIVATPDFEKNDVLLILIPGENKIQAGEWSRKAIFEEGLDVGTQLPYVEKAINSGYAVMVMNPGQNFCYSVMNLPLVGSPKAHGKYVWDAYVKHTRASKILIVAHLYGGTVTTCLANLRKMDFEQRVAGVALLDSVHINSEYNVTTFLKKISKHWVTSPIPLDTPCRSQNFDVPKVSSGHSRPGMTPYSCMNSVFQFFEEKLSASQVITEQVKLA